VVDHRGHGRTNNPENKFTSYGRLAWDMVEFIKEHKKVIIKRILATKPI
jgi:alpha-beta hydrolase superfamily lysophospholipase